MKTIGENESKECKACRESREGRAKDKLFNFRPVFFAAVFLCLGIVFSRFVVFNGVSPWRSLLLLSAAATPFFFCRSKKRFAQTGFAVLALAVAFAAGFFSFRAQVRNFVDCPSYDGEYSVHGRVVEIKEYEYSFFVALDRVQIDGKAEKGKLVAYLPATSAKNLRLADEVSLLAEVRTDTDLFNERGFYAEKLGENIRFFASATECRVTGRAFAPFLFVRERIRTVVFAGMDETPAAVTMAALTGDTSGIEDGLLSNVRYGGIAHLFAVSGLHIGALFGACTLLFKKTRCKRFPKIVKFSCVAGILLFYGGVCGFSASVTRAVTVCLVFYFTSLVGVSSDSTENLGLAAIATLLISPSSLFTVGFQLSFTACLGIFWLGRFIRSAIDGWIDGLAEKIKRRIGKQPSAPEEKYAHPPTVAQRILRAGASFFSVTLAAQIATAPLLLSSFGYFSGWSLLLNVLFVPLISAVFSVLLAIVAVACLLPVGCSAVVLYVPSVVWTVFLLLFETVDFSAFCLTGITLSGGAAFCYFAGLVFLSDKWNITARQRRILSVACFLAFAICLCAANL